MEQVIVVQVSLEIGKVEIIPNEYGKIHTPSYINITDNEILFGKTAKNQLPYNLNNTFYKMKTLFGKKYFNNKINDLRKYLTFDLKEGPKNILFGENGKYSSEEIFYQIFKKLKENAEKYLEKEINNVVISIPILFFYHQRRGMKRIAAKAGFNDIRLIPVTTAAAFAFGFDKTFNDEKTILTFDLGGGFLDIAILNIEEELYETTSVIGDDTIGGLYFDIRLVEHCADEFRRKTNKDINSNKKSMLRLLKSCENAKKIFSCQNQENIELIIYLK